MNREIFVRNYQPADLRNLKRILSEYPSPTGRIWSGDIVEEMICDALKESPDGVFLAEIDEKVVGFAVVMHQRWFNIACLDYIQVLTEWVDKGIGHQLIGKCITWAIKKGARILYPETGKDNERAIKFYQKHGFKITGHIPDYYQKGLDAVILVDKLS